MSQMASKRKSSTRTKSGCAVCRTRKVRCGEQAPSCHNCLRSGWTCPGYSKSKATNGSSAIPPSNGSITTYHLPYSVPGSQEERQALHYFAVSAAEHIGGYFSADFWTRSVLQRCQHDAPVRHAVAALSCVHREYTASSVQAAFEASERAVTAYTRSMKALRRYLRQGSKPDVRVAMMCCAAFFCFELIRGEQGSALQHLHSGIRILHQWQTRSLVPIATLAQETDRSQLVDVFARMDIQASTFDDGAGLAARKSALDGIYLEEDPSGEATKYQQHDLGPVKYSLLLRRCFSFLVDRVAWRGKKLEDVPDGLRKTRNALLDELKVWHEHLDTLKARDSNEKLPLHLQRAVTRSKLHSTMMVIVIQYSLPFPEPPSNLDDRADELLQRASEAMGMDGDQEPEDGGPARRHFCLHLGVVAPLFLLAIKTCRADVLASCLRLLRASRGRREGLYDADITAQVVEALMSQNDEVAGRSLLDQMGDDAETRLQEAVENVVPGRLDSTRRVRGLCRLLVLAG